MPRFYSLPFIMLLAALSLFSGCAAQPLGYGVLLWAPDSLSLESGAVVTVLTESEISDTYGIQTGDGTTEIDRWRVELYESEGLANQASAEYTSIFTGNTNLQARATRNALPIRDEPEATSTNTVYRLREGEEIKLIGRESEETDLQGLISYWYEALTESGERGWVFGYTLDIYDPTDPSVTIDSGRSEDPLLDLLLSNIWRPIYYIDMISNNTIDLELFRVEHGLFPDAATRTFELVLPAHARLFEYERVSRVGSRRYIAEGTSLNFTFQRGDELSVQYRIGDEQFVIAMQRVDAPVQQYIDAEIARRADRYGEITELGPSFRSDNYGSLSFDPGLRFRWSGFDQLVPRAIPAGSGTTGRVELGLFLSAALEDRFDGALSFRFDGASDPASFAYSLEPAGIRLVWIPPASIDDRLVRNVGTTTLTIFMSSGA